MMRLYFTTGSTFEKDDLPQRLGLFKTFHAAESAARQLLISEPSGVIYLYLPFTNSGAAALPLQFMGWRARYSLVRIVTSLKSRRSGTPFLFGTFGVFDEDLRLRANFSESATGKESLPVDCESLSDVHDAERSLSLA